MDTGSGSRREEIRGRFEQERRNLQELVRQTPKTSEEYRELAILDRLEIAKRVLEKYASISDRNRRAGDPPDDKTGLHFEMDTDDPHIRDSVRVAYDKGRAHPSGDPRSIQKHPGIKVWVGQVDTTDQIPVDFIYIGEIEFGSYVTDDAELVHEAHALLGLDNRQPLTHGDAQYMIEFIDEAVSRLIDGPIAARRRKIDEEALRVSLVKRERRIEEPSIEETIELPSEQVTQPPEVPPVSEPAPPIDPEEPHGLYFN